MKKVFDDFYEKGIINKITNVTHICLIPKKKDSIEISDFRPVSLVTSLYKLIAKVLPLVFKEVLSETISDAHSAFVKGHQIVNAVSVANEVVEDCRKKKKAGMVIKIDFEKPYHHLYWNFVDLVFQAKGVGCKWRRWIKGCLQSVNFSVFIN